MVAFSLGMLSHRVWEYADTRRSAKSDRAMYLRQLSEMCYDLEKLDVPYPSNVIEDSIRRERLNTLQEWYEATKGLARQKEE